jgi:tetratricopeptide (TPR) repeat protein
MVGTMSFSVMLLFAALAHADGPDPNAKQLFLAGQQAYDAGRYDIAIRAFEAAQALAPSDLLVFDLAQSYRKKFLAVGDYDALDKAIELYRRFVATSANGHERPMATDAIAELLIIAAKRNDTAPRSDTPESDYHQPKTEIMVVSNAPGALVSLDGKEASRAPLLEVVTPGQHRAHATAPGFLPADAAVTAVAERFVVSEVRLQPLPALLQLSASRTGALQMDGATVGKIPAGAFEVAAGHHHLQLRSRGYQLWERDVEVERGARLQLRADLRPTTQRRAVRWVGLAAGLFGVAAITSGIVWATSYRSAVALFPKTAAGFGPYNQAVSTSNEARIGTSVCIAIGGSLAITTLLLYLIDQGSPRSDSPRQ